MKTKKMYYVLFSFIALAFTFVNCSSDDNKAFFEKGEAPKQPNETVNQAPEDFDLIAVIDGAIDVDVKPEFLWNAATDPDEDALSYELFIDGNTDPTTSIASNINDTNFTLEDRLPLNENLFWKVMASDSEGLTTTSNIFSFTTRDLKMPPTPVNANAGFSGRTDHTSVVFKDKIWVIGGYDGVSRLNDVWNSVDGETWTQVISEAAFHKRGGHTSVVFDNKVWVIGGYTGTDYLRDIWQSGDGETWTKITGATPFPPNGLHSVVAFKDKLWVIGSLDESAKLTNSIWQSTDGEIWTPIDSVSPFPERTGHTTLVFDDKIWIIGGEDFNGLRDDVWQSNDGRIWSKVTENNIFGGIIHHTSVVFDNKMWIIAGRGSRFKTNDIYQTRNGIVWSKVIAEVPFIEREGHSTVAFDGRIWVIGGTGSIVNPSNLNDVWSMY